MKISTYTVHVKPDDKGERLKVKTTATTPEQAAKQVTDYLNAPLSAVIKIVEQIQPTHIAGSNDCWHMGALE